MAEAQLQQIWMGLMPSFPELTTLLNISDPDDRAVTMLLKTLYVVFKGVLEERHRLRCCEGRTHAPKPGTIVNPPTSARPDSVAAVPGRDSVEEIVPCSPGDLVPPSPSNGATFSGSRRTVSASAPSAETTVLAPETADATSPRRPGRLPRPVAETAPPPPPPPPPPVVWVPETLDAVCPARADHRPRPVAETVQLPSLPPVTPPRPVKQSEAVSPVLPGRTQGSRRARRAASRAGAAPSPVPPQPLTPPPRTEAAGVGASSQMAQKSGVEVTSPTPSLTSPLLLPQRLPERTRRLAVPETTLAESPKGRTERAATGSVRRTSRLSRAKPSQTERDPSTKLVQHASQTGSSRQSPPPKKKKYIFIGPNDPVPPRKSRTQNGVASAPTSPSASPQKDAQRNAPPSESSSTLLPQRRPPSEAVSRPAVIPTKTPSRADSGILPTEGHAQSVLELHAAPTTAQQISPNRGHCSNDGPAAGERAPPTRNPTSGKPAEQTGGPAHLGAGGGPSQAAESVVELDVLLEELDCEGAQTQAQGQVGHKGQGQEGERNPEKGQTETHRVIPSREDLQARGDAEAVREETTAPPHDHLREHESQDETQMDSEVFGDQQPAAGPSRKYDAGPVRRRADRQKLPGWSCNLCKEWYADRDMTEEELRAHMNRCSRHRQNEPPPPDTPAGFWDPVGFPSMNITQYGGERPRTSARRKP